MAKKNKGKRPAAKRVLKVVYDERLGAATEIRADERPTPEMINQIVRELCEFADPGVFPFPLDRVEVARREYANRKRDLLDVLYNYGKGSIGKLELIAGREFQAAYDVAHDIRIGSVNAERTGNGQVDHLAIVKRRIRAGDRVNDYLDMIGGMNAVPRLAVEFILGRRCSLRDMVIRGGQDTSYWRGALVSGLETLAHHAISGRRRRPS